MINLIMVHPICRHNNGHGFKITMETTNQAHIIRKHIIDYLRNNLGHEIADINQYTTYEKEGDKDE